MAALDFPASPTLNQIYTANGKSWIWDGTAWNPYGGGISTLPIANGGTGQTTQTAAFDALAPTTTKGDIIVHNGTDNVRVPVGTDGHTLVADSAEASGVKWAAGGGGGGKIAQVVAATTSTAFSTTSTVPQDNTIPQSSEGAEFMTVTITPTNASSTIEVSFVGTGTSDGGKNVVLALFEGSASSAFAADYFYTPIANGMTSMPLLGRIAAGSTTARTYRLRVGMSGATPGTARMISDSGGSYFGGVRNCILRATEILP